MAYEFFTLVLGDFTRPRMDVANVNETLNSLSLAGWEVFSVQPNYILLRRASQTQPVVS